MKNRIFLTCLLLFTLISIAQTANGADKQTTAESLGQAVVSNPDSVLQVLDKMATSKSKALQAYQINLLRSQAYNAKHMYPLVERYAERTLASDSINNHPNDKLSALLLLADARAFFGNYQGSIESAQEAMKIARATDNKPAEYGILSRMARTAFAVGNRKQGYEYLDRIIAEGESSTDAHILANVSATYGTKIIELYTDDRFSEGLANSYKRLALIKKMDELEGCPEGFTDQQRAYTYARLAACAEKCEKTDEARKAYDSFMQTTYAQHPMGRAFIMDYLLESHQWKKVLEFTAPLYPILAQGDTINDDYRSLLISDGMAQAGLGNYRKGYELTQRAAAIQDSLYFREKSSRAQELATIFDLNEKELELANTQAQSQRSNILLLTAIGAGLLVLVILVLMVHAYRQSVKREKLAVRQIDELLAPHHMTTSSSDAEKEDFRLFNEMQRKIVDERLFKSPDFNRDGIVEATGLTRAKVTQLIKQFTNDGINDYINRLRVEYSVQVIKDHPEWTIDAIAESCGYIRRATYYNHFKARFGITPAQYRKERSKTADQPEA
jgi:AraC-like DNA-binding protein